jgi:hypothetical protein
MKSMPWLDIGDLPATYTSTKSEAFQVFMHTQSKLPHNLVIEYREWANTYDVARLRSEYNNYLFSTKGVTLHDLEDTLEQANLIVNPYIGRFAKIEKIKNISLGVGFAVFLCSAIAVGIVSDSYGWAAFIVIMYIIGCFLAFYLVRHTSSRLFRNT